MSRDRPARTPLAARAARPYATSVLRSELSDSSGLIRQHRQEVHKLIRATNDVKSVYNAQRN